MTEQGHVRDGDRLDDDATIVNGGGALDAAALRPRRADRGPPSRPRPRAPCAPRTRHQTSETLPDGSASSTDDVCACVLDGEARRRPPSVTLRSRRSTPPVGARSSLRQPGCERLRQRRRGAMDCGEVGDGGRARRRPRPHPLPPAAVGHLRPRLRVGRLGCHRRPLQDRHLVLRSALALATRPGREPEPHLALVVPRGADLAGLDPAHVNDVGGIVNNQRRRNLGYQSPASLYAAASTVR